MRSEREWDPRSMRATVRTLSFPLSEVRNIEHRALSTGVVCCV